VTPVPAARRPPPGGAVEVAPGVTWVRMPLPYALDHVNLWLLAEEDGFTLVDTGHGDAATRAAWEALESGLLRGRPVRRVICTHHHPDHVGLAGWMAGRWGAELWATRTEWLEARACASAGLAEQEAAATRFYRSLGVPEAELPALAACFHAYPENVSTPPATFRRIRDGEVLTAGGRDWKVRVGRGHAPEHACLHAAGAGLLVSGDQLLPHISPNVSVWHDEPDADPLAEFLESLEALRDVDDGCLVLPSHGHPFRGARQRCDELAHHHRERLAAALEACEEPRTPHEVVAALFRGRLDAHQSTFALGEALAHLHRLEAEGRVERVRRPGAPDRFRRRGSPGGAVTAGG
jgi:glyoxylase-like metal-dependent hydrolase (beta-lactamase superfamily II)